MLDGLANENLNIKHAAFLDLFYLSKYEPLRRKNLYERTENWDKLMEESCKIINLHTEDIIDATYFISSTSNTNWFFFKSFLYNFISSDASDTPLWQVSSPKERSKILFSNIQLNIWVIQALSDLIAFSKHHDSLGTVHSSHSIDRVLYTLISYLIAIRNVCSFFNSFFFSSLRSRFNFVIIIHHLVCWVRWERTIQCSLGGTQRYFSLHELFVHAFNFGHL